MLSDIMNLTSTKQANATMHGVYSAKVTDNKDPKKFGRVKITIPIIDEKMEFDWVRVATMVAGEGKGTMFIPEIGDEVLVSFLMGDIKAPIVIGSLWKEKQLPDGYNEANDVKKIKTKLGHEIIFDDNKDDGKLIVKTKGGNKLELLDKKNEINIKTGKENLSITLNEGTGKLEVKAANTVITLTKDGEVKITGQKAISIEGAKIKIAANSDLELKANAKISLQASGMVEIKGAMIKLN